MKARRQLKRNFALVKPVPFHGSVNIELSVVRRGRNVFNLVVVKLFFAGGKLLPLSLVVQSVKIEKHNPLRRDKKYVMPARFSVFIRKKRTRYSERI